MKDHVHVKYERDGDMIGLDISGCTNIEMRQVLIGLWNRLDAEDKAEVINEMNHMQTALGATLSPLAQTISLGDLDLKEATEGSKRQ